MGKKRTKAGNRQGLQAVTLCISTAMVLILLGMVVFSVLTARNLSSYVRENLVITMMLDQDMSNPEAQKLCTKLKARPYIHRQKFISKEEALREQTREMGVDPSEFTGGENPFLGSVELTLKADYANTDSLGWIVKELKNYPKVSDVTYQKDLIDSVNQSLGKISVGLLVLAVLLTFVSFTLISNTVRLGIYARRFSIHTMKLVGASWSFIRKPFLTRAVYTGVLAAFLACLVLGGLVYALYLNEPDTLLVVTWEVMAITAASVFLFGIILTALCARISVNKFLRMKAGELYKI